MAALALGLVVLLLAPAAPAAAAKGPAVWHAALIVFKSADGKAVVDGVERQHRSAIPQSELNLILESFEAFKGLAQALSEGEVTIESRTFVLDKPLEKVECKDGGCMPDYQETMRVAYGLHEGLRRFDSVFVVWPQGQLPSKYFLGSYVPDRPPFTYAMLGSADARTWMTPRVGEPFLHEWLHGVAFYLRALGYKMPHRDADGAEDHFYNRGEKSGWSVFYRDLMTGRVLGADPKAAGITPEMWRCGPPSKSEL